MALFGLGIAAVTAVVGFYPLVTNSVDLSKDVANVISDFREKYQGHFEQEQSFNSKISEVENNISAAEKNISDLKDTIEVVRKTDSQQGQIDQIQKEVNALKLELNILKALAKIWSSEEALRAHFGWTATFSRRRLVSRSGRRPQ